MKLEKRGDVTPEEAAAAEEVSQKSAGKQKPVLLYLVILFAIALFLILFSFLVQNHTSAMEMQELQNQADAAQELRIQYSESQAENESLRQQIESLNSQIAEDEKAQRAMELLWKLERLYLAGDNAGCQTVLAALQADDLYLSLPETTAAEGDTYETPRAAYDRILAELTGSNAAQ